MPGFFRGVWGLAVLFGEIVCILGASASARAQSAAPPAQANRSEAVLSTTVGPSLSRTSHVETFAAFLREIGADDLAERKEAITGRKQPRIDWLTLNRVSIGLTDDQWNAAWAILLDGSQRVSDWGDAMQETLGWRNGQFETAATDRAAKAARFDALSAQGDSIVEATIASLRQQLGDDAFSKLDAFVYAREGGKKLVDQGPIRKGQIETAQASPFLTHR